MTKGQKTEGASGAFEFVCFQSPLNAHSVLEPEWPGQRRACPPNT